MKAMTKAIGVVVTDVGHGVAAVTLGSARGCEVRVAENHGHDNWMACAYIAGSAVTCFCGKTYKTQKSSVTAASKWLETRASAA